MFLFWLITVLMVVVALGFVLVPLMRSTKADADVLDESAVNVAVYRERMAELEADRAEGKIDDKEFARLQLEQQRALLEDDAMVVAKKAGHEGARWVLPALVLVLLPLSSYGLYLKLGASDLLTLPPQAEAANPHGEGSMEGMAIALLQELEADPNNSQGWFTLGRTYTAIGRYEQAAEAFDRVSQILGKEHAEILAQKAQALYFGSGNQVTPQIQAIIDQALADDDMDPGLNGLLGMIAYDSGNFADAVMRWERMLTNIRPGMSEEGIRQAIEMARQQLAGSGGELPAAASSSPASAAAASGQGVFGDKPLKVLVEIDPGLLEQVDGSSTVFVALKRADGPPMPLAAVRLQAGQLPTLVSIDDRNLLTQGVIVDSGEALLLSATLSKSGTAGTKSGDLRGVTSPMTLSEMGEKVIQVNIDSVVP
ncbi:c-type cytochrome biogenesis protein CcmI [Aestuariirhabdus litorea]|uniref:C-type cytochrome biogenesis protein CcmI n=1 Tax=Aestuariirhabdus litorea TaxID=2528527 RepID=A0A3P3VR61_9GAMM|nr:c-type cytochrome biogenesis protein CcmI [Aestuariirhabdus litorea]RRJ85282.1 c-type cytochrome biogenesis protein CcmI [Aestuariirhabdus litorea]RWW98503.1 c-type cytochrome biogenesis protein CcmI [Endozoicomonadaceae bacterium GTF-13]